MNKSNKNNKINILRGIPGLTKLSVKHLTLILDCAEYKLIDKGKKIIREGQKADNFYIILKGRFAVLRNKEPIAEITSGEPVGELAFFSGEPRTADVVALRNSEVLIISRKTWTLLSQKAPAIPQEVLKTISKRLVRATTSVPTLLPRKGNICSIFPGQNFKLPEIFAEKLRHIFSEHSNWKVICQRDVPKGVADNASSLQEWLENAEDHCDNLLLICEESSTKSPWPKAVARCSDTIFIALPQNDGHFTDPSTTPMEELLFESTLKPNIHLVIWRNESNDSTKNSAFWLKNRPVSLHHHIALNSDVDFARLSRFIQGKATGLVLCGGGSFGSAHMGAVKAFQEHGYHFDFFGGTSAGAAIAGALSTGALPSTVMEMSEEIFIKSKAMSRYTVPKYSILDHHALDDGLERVFDGYEIEDTPLNFFSVATSLTYNDVTVLRRGKLWQAIRASGSLPGIYPPFITDDGEVLIDGGLLDNVPLDIMRSLKPGPNLVLNFETGKPWKVSADYFQLPTRKEALLSLLRLGKRYNQRFPKISSVMSRAMVVNARKLLNQTEIGDDVLINLPTLQGMSFLDWKRGRELFDHTYNQISQLLEQVQLDENDFEGDFKFAKLRKVAEIINASDQSNQA